MEFIELFNGFAILMIGLLFISGLVTVYNTAYNDDILEDSTFGASLGNATSHLNTGFLGAGLNYANSTTPTEGQGTSTSQQDNLLGRAWNTITNLRELLGLAPALIEDAGRGIQLQDIYVDIAKALFWIVFSLTLAYLLIIGARSLT